MLSVPIIITFIIAIVTSWITKSWRSPGSFFAFCWAFFLITPFIFAPEYEMDQLGVWFIAIFTMSLAAGSILAYSPFHDNYIISPKHHFNFKKLYFILFILCVISFIGIYFLFQFASNIYGSENYKISWLAIPNLIAVDRYNEVLNYPYLIKYSLYIIYPANLLAGLLFAKKDTPKKYKILLIVPLIASLILGIIEGARTSILLGLIMFFSSWLSAMVSSKTPIPLNKVLIKISVGTITFFGFFITSFIFIQWLRQGMDTIIIDLLFDRIRAYFFGYLAAFTQWFNSSVELNFSAGFITFAGPYNLIGIIDRPLGFYDSIQITKGVTTNIFTVFRGIITDFSMSGSLIIAFIFGFILQSIFQRKNTTSLKGTLPISMFYAFTLYSPLISIFHYNSILFSWFILLIFLELTKYEPLDNYC